MKICSIKCSISDRIS